MLVAGEKVNVKLLVGLKQLKIIWMSIRRSCHAGSESCEILRNPNIKFKTIECLLNASVTCGLRRK